MDRDMLEQVRKYLIRKGYPSSVLRIDPLFYMMGITVLDLNLFEHFIDDEVVDGMSYQDYFKEHFGDNWKCVTKAFGIDPSLCEGVATNE